MPTVLNWPTAGEWHLSNPKSPVGRNATGFYRKQDPPFAVLTVNFKQKVGTIRQLRTTATISGIQLRQTADGPKFSAAYAIGANSGRFEATVLDKYDLEIEFTGTVVTAVTGRPMNLTDPDRSVASLSTQDKLQEAIRRALPLMPSEVGRQVEALFTPQAIAIMAGLAGLWVASHYAVIGVIADIALIITGGILLGAAAWDVGTHLAGFLTKATGATTDAELDSAAQDFAAAVLLGGVAVVGSILLSKRPGRGVEPVKGPPARPGELPTNLNAVPVDKIPTPQRAQLVNGRPARTVPSDARLRDMMSRQQAGEVVALDTVLRPAIGKPVNGRIGIAQGSGRYEAAAEWGMLDVFIPSNAPRPPGTQIVRRGVPPETVRSLNLLSSRGAGGSNPIVVDAAMRGVGSWDHVRILVSELLAPMARPRPR
jgi:hypothetical protein